MGFRWPWLGLLMLVLPLLIVGYRWLLRQRRTMAAGFSHLALVQAAAPAPGWRRHLPAIALGVVVALGLVAAARPTISIDDEASRTSIILAVDVSRSMCAVDVEPNRLTAAQQAARSFVAAESARARIGIVAFAGFAELVVEPTSDSEVLVGAIDGLRTSFGTAMGSAVVRSIDALAANDPTMTPVQTDLAQASLPPVVDDNRRSDDVVPDIIVVLTDGASTQGVDPLIAASAAAERGVRVFTVGFGTDAPTTMLCNPAQAGADFITDQFGDQSVTGIGAAGDFGQTESGGSMTGQFLVIDEPTLESVASLTGGEFYRAADADQLVQVFSALPVQPVPEPRDVEVTAIVAAACAVIVMAVMLHGAGRRPKHRADD